MLLEAISKLSALMRQSPPHVGPSVSNAPLLLSSIKDRDEIIEKRYNYARKNVQDAEKLWKTVLTKKMDRTRYEHLAEKVEDLAVKLNNLCETCLK